METSSGANDNVSQATLTVRTMVIRDGTPGISLSMGRQLLGEWTDSRAKTLSVTEDHKAKVHGDGGAQLYLVSAPGKVLSSEVVSETEVAITFEI